MINATFNVEYPTAGEAQDALERWTAELGDVPEITMAVKDNVLIVTFTGLDEERYDLIFRGFMAMDLREKTRRISPN